MDLPNAGGVQWFVVLFELVPGFGFVPVNPASPLAQRYVSATQKNMLQAQKMFKPRTKVVKRWGCAYILAIISGGNMEYAALIKALMGLFSAIGAIVAYKHNSIKAKQSQAELIIKFEEALKNNNKYSICELFNLIYGVRMDYDDIIEVTKRNDVSKIVFALKKTPGMVKFENGNVQYSTVFKNKWMQFLDKYISRMLTYSFGAIALILILAMPFVKGAVTVSTFILLITSLTFFALQLKDMRYGNMVRNLIHSK